MLVVGLTGGIGTGKSTIAESFKQLGVPVLDTDQLARELVQPGQPALHEIRKQFGDAVITAHGELDRAALRHRVFSDPQQRRQLEAILHPRIRQRIQAWITGQQACYVMVVIPLLFESGMDDLVDHALVVDCDPARQRERIQQRDNLDTTTLDAILAAQLPRAERLARADQVLDNSGTPAAAHCRVIELDRQYRALC